MLDPNMKSKDYAAKGKAPRYAKGEALRRQTLKKAYFIYKAKVNDTLAL